MKYPEDFKTLLNTDLPDGYIGHGNPNSKILIIGQEPAHDKESTDYNIEIANNKYKWQTLIENNMNPEFQFSSPIWPWPNQKFIVRSLNSNNRTEKVYRGNEGTSKTWYNYQKLIYKILDKEIIKGGPLDFHSLSFHTDMSAEASKKHNTINTQKAKDSVKRRSEGLFSLPFFQNFPIVIAAVGNFPKETYGDSYFHDTFGVKWIPDKSICEGHWININIREDDNHPQLLIHCWQMSANISNNDLDNIAKFVRQFSEEKGIKLSPR